MSTLSAVLNTSMSKHVMPDERKAVMEDTSTGEAKRETAPAEGGKEGAMEARELEGKYALWEQKVEGGGGSRTVRYELRPRDSESADEE